MKSEQKDINVIFDIDGVVLDYVSGFFQWLNAEKNLEASILPVEVNLFGLHNFFECHPDEFKAFYTEFGYSQEFRELECLDGIIPFIKELDHAGLRIHAVTACGDEIISQARRECLSSKGWEWPVDTVELGASKYEKLAQFRPDRSIFIDDLYDNLNDAHKLGMQTIWYKGIGMRYEDKGELDVTAPLVTTIPELKNTVAMKLEGIERGSSQLLKLKKASHFEMS